MCTLSRTTAVHDLGAEDLKPKCSRPLRLLILTDITPDPLNAGGPSGLIWEVQQTLVTAGYEVHVRKLASASGISRVLRLLGIRLGRAEIIGPQYDKVICYPFHVAFRLARSEMKRAIVLGPDSPSLLYARFCRATLKTKWLKKLRNASLRWWFEVQEASLARHMSAIVVVGKNDRRWIRQHLTLAPSDAHKLIYLPLPILSQVVRGTAEFERCVVVPPTFVFSGDLSPKYVGTFFDELIEALSLRRARLGDATLLFVGRNAKWMYNTVMTRTDELSWDVRWIEWVEEYADICIPSKHIHCFPLVAGAGTKNRVLTAAALSVPMVGTQVAFENVRRWLDPATAVMGRSAVDFAEGMIRLALELQLQWRPADPHLADNVGVEYRNVLISIFETRAALPRRRA